MLIWNPTMLLLRLPALLICLIESSLASDGPIHLVFDFDETTTTPPDNKYPDVTRGADGYQICDYDLCVAQEESCQDIAAKLGCLCPGITPQTEPPLAPQVKGVSPAESGQVTVHWCAPFSFVSQYRVTVEGKEGQSVFEGMSRNVTLAGLKVGQRVCVQAVNSAGMSSLSEESCSTYHRPESQASTPLLAGVIAGGLGFILLLTVMALILWRRKACCKGGTDSPQGLRNPSFSTDGTL
ncbi:LRRN4 C-terminal-like protein [Sardina pilchardus]|uniref:LRRN4 C-terminal-like protein n=1 Tax=Sardina pilchardus TaxID=27697 RepID=UPI002E1395A4